MKFQIVKSASEINVLDLFNRRGEYFVEDIKLRVKAYENSLHLEEIENAMMRGKTTVSYSISTPGWSKPTILNFLGAFGDDISTLLSALHMEKWQDAEYSCINIQYNDENINISRSTSKAVRTFSPFVEMAPLKSIPKRWTTSSLFRLISNGQFENLECNGRYTDDYAFDAAYDFMKGEIQNALSFARKILESPRGWRMYNSGDVLHINCHHFDYNSLTIKI